MHRFCREEQRKETKEEKMEQEEEEKKRTEEKKKEIRGGTNEIEKRRSRRCFVVFSWPRRWEKRESFEIF